MKTIVIKLEQLYRVICKKRSSLQNGILKSLVFYDNDSNFFLAIARKILLSILQMEMKKKSSNVTREISENNSEQF